MKNLFFATSVLVLAACSGISPAGSSSTIKNDQNGSMPPTSDLATVSGTLSAPAACPGGGECDVITEADGTAINLKYATSYMGPSPTHSADGEQVIASGYYQMAQSPLDSQSKKYLVVTTMQIMVQTVQVNPAGTDAAANTSPETATTSGVTSQVTISGTLSVPAACPGGGECDSLVKGDGTTINLKYDPSYSGPKITPALDGKLAMVTGYYQIVQNPLSTTPMQYLVVTSIEVGDTLPHPVMGVSN